MTHINIIAEIGVNWGSPYRWDTDQAIEMIGLAKESGADMAKFQYFRTQDIMGHPRRMELMRMAMTPSLAKYLISKGADIGMPVFFTPENAECVADLELAGNPVYKIGHNNCNNEEMLEAIVRTGKDMIISIPSNQAMPYITIPGAKVKYLYCNTEYPTKDEDITLRMFGTLAKFGTVFNGFSDHTRGITASIAAAARGAEIIEKHVMLDDDYTCIDKEVSISFEELRTLVQHVRRIEKMCSRS